MKAKKTGVTALNSSLSLATVPFPIVRKANPMMDEKRAKYGLNSGFTSMCITAITLLYS